MPTGKFNGGQKLATALFAGLFAMQLLTGSLMNWNEPFSDSWRTGATFVHDSTWLVLIIAISGHIMFALRDFDSLRSMVRGWVPESWARRERPRWWAEIVTARGGSAAAIGDVVAGGEQRLREPGARAREVTVGDGVEARAGDRLRGRNL